MSGMEALVGGHLVESEGCVGLAQDPDGLTGSINVVFGVPSVAVDKHDGSLMLLIGGEHYEYGEMVFFGGGYIPRSAFPDDIVTIPQECEAENLYWVDEVLPR